MGNEEISAELLASINSSLPKGESVPDNHPEYMLEDKSNDINIGKEARDITLTFISENGYDGNSLGYYTYPTGKPPVTEADITDVRVVIPNTSLRGASGGMRCGNKIDLGRFEAGTSIGFVLLKNSWNAESKSIDPETTDQDFSGNDLNIDEKSKALMRHAVMLNDAKDNLLVASFEESNRSDGSSDDDFNDLVFYVNNPDTDPVAIADYELLDSPVDSDGDGIIDVCDPFPNDPGKVYYSITGIQNMGHSCI